MLPDATTDIPAWAGKDKDEPFDVKEFLESRSIPPDNAAPLYYLAFADIDDWFDFVYPPDQWKERLPKVQAIEKGINSLIPKFEDLDFDSVSLTDAENLLEKAKPVFQQMDKAQQRPKCMFVEKLDIDSPNFCADAAEFLCRFELLQILHAAKSANLAEAEQAITRILRLAHDLRPRGCRVRQRASMMMEIAMIHAINHCTLNQKSITAEDCDKILDTLIEYSQDPIPVLQEGPQVDYIIFRNLIEDLRTGRLSHEKFISWLKEAKTTDEDIADLKNGLQQVSWPAEIGGYNRTYALILRLIDKPYYEMSTQQLEEKIAAQVRSDNLRFTWRLITDLQALRDGWLDLVAKRGSIQCMIAVRKYELTHGKLPPYLSTAIAGTALKETPTDPYTGKPMRYESDGKSFKILYGAEQHNPFESGN